MFLYYIKTIKFFYLPKIKKKRLLNFLRSPRKLLESNLHMLKLLKQLFNSKLSPYIARTL